MKHSVLKLLMYYLTENLQTSRYYIKEQLKKKKILDLEYTHAALQTK